MFQVGARLALASRLLVPRDGLPGGLSDGREGLFPETATHRPPAPRQRGPPGEWEAGRLLGVSRRSTPDWVASTLHGPGRRRSEMEVSAGSPRESLPPASGGR